MAFVDVRGDNECWEWQGHRNWRGYGAFTIGRDIPPVGAHRMSYELSNGPIPDGLWVRHTCDNPPCVNPAHLILGEPVDNVRDMMDRDRYAKRHRRKLSDDDVRAVRTRWAAGGVTQKALAAEYGIARSTICQIIARTHCADVE